MSRPSTARVAVLMGSTSDEDTMKKCLEGLEYFRIPFEVHVMSAHRNPDEVDDFAIRARDRGIEVIIAAAGMAAHLPGVVAARTTLPVIGVPLSGSALGGLDALYSIVQMPSGIPVATMAVDSAGAKNAAVMAAEILALKGGAILDRLKEFRKAGSRF